MAQVEITSTAQNDTSSAAPAAEFFTSQRDNGQPAELTSADAEKNKVTDDVPSSEVFTYHHEDGRIITANAQELGRCAFMADKPEEQRVFMARQFVLGQELQKQKEKQTEEKEEPEAEMAEKRPENNLEPTENNSRMGTKPSSDSRKSEKDSQPAEVKEISAQTTISQSRGGEFDFLEAQTVEPVENNRSGSSNAEKPASQPTSAAKSRSNENSSSRSTTGEVTPDIDRGTESHITSETEAVSERRAGQPSSDSLKIMTTDTVITENSDKSFELIEAIDETRALEEDAADNHQEASVELDKLIDEIVNEEALKTPSDQEEVDYTIVLAEDEDSANNLTFEIPSARELSDEAEDVEDVMLAVNERLQELSEDETEESRQTVQETSDILNEIKLLIEQESALSDDMEIDSETFELQEANIESQEREDKLKELFRQLFEKLELDYTEEQMDACVKFALVGKFDKALLKENNVEEEAVPTDTGTHEVLNRIIGAASSVKKTLAHACAIGKAILRLYIHNFSQA